MNNLVLKYGCRSGFFFSLKIFIFYSEQKVYYFIFHELGSHRILKINFKESEFFLKITLFFKNNLVFNAKN